MELKNCPFCGGKATTYEYQSSYLAQCDSCSFALTPEEWNRRAESDLLAALKRLHDSDPNASQCTEDELVDAANHDGDPVVREQAAAFLQARAAIARHS